MEPGRPLMLKDGETSKIELTDRLSFGDAAAMRITKDGYLVTQPRVARTGIQLYRGSEVGRPELDVVRVYRAEDQVFHADSFHTFAYRPITDDHPPVPVQADNWKQYSVGQTGGDVVRDGQFIRVPMVLMDQTAIKKVRDGKVELSVGYLAEIKWGKGVSPQGEHYDAQQVGINVNHIALTDAARGGDKLRIGDEDDNKDKKDGGASDDNPPDKLSKSTHGDKAMEKLIVDGVTIELEDALTAGVIRKAVKDLETRVSSLSAKLAEEEEAKKTAATDSAANTTKLQAEIVTKDAEIAKLKQQIADAAMTPQRLDALVKDRAEVVAKAKALIGDTLVVDGKTEAEIRKAVVDAKMGDTAKSYNDDMVKVAFDTLTSGIKLDGTAPAPSNGASQQMAHAFKQDTRTTAQHYDAYDKKLSERWKTAGIPTQ